MYRDSIKEGRYSYGISAIDASGNESAITWANNCADENMWGYCWYLTMDATPPEPVRMIIPKYNK